MRLKYWQKLLYAAGSLGVALSYQVFGTYIQFFYIDILGVKASLVGIGWSVYGIWNAVNDPLAGYWSDNTKTRWGRRIPWIAGVFIPVGLFFYLLWVPPSPLIKGGQIPLFVYFMAVVLIFDLLWTLVVLNWTALFPEMITDEKERASVSGWRQFFSLLGVLVGVALPPVLVGADWSRRGGMALSLPPSLRQPLASPCSAAKRISPFNGRNSRRFFRRSRPLCKAWRSAGLSWRISIRNSSSA